MSFKVLSIDAWADCCGCECEEGKPNCWSWNNWHKVGEIDVIPQSDIQKIEVLIMEGFLKPAARSFVYVDDDQYNYVICDKTNNQPIFAIEYGNHELVGTETDSGSMFSSAGEY